MTLEEMNDNTFNNFEHDEDEEDSYMDEDLESGAVLPEFDYEDDDDTDSSLTSLEDYATSSPMQVDNTQASSRSQSVVDEDDDDEEFAPRRKRGRPLGSTKKKNQSVVLKAPKTTHQNTMSGVIPLPTAEVELEKILFYRIVKESTENGEEEVEKTEFLIKFKNRSYLHCEWVEREWIETHDKRGKLRLKHFLEKTVYDFAYGLLSEDKPFNDSFVKIDRIIDHVDSYADPFTGETSRWFLIKWNGLPYENCTWESETVLYHVCDDVEESIESYFYHAKLPIDREPGYYQRYIPPKMRPPVGQWKKYETSPEYKDENQLRPYQLEGLNWLMYCWYHNQSSLIADEMGLGKTVQSVVFLNELYQLGVRGPFLIIAPLSTIAHWERTVTGWTNLNCVVFHGSSVSRNVIHRYEYYYKDLRTGKRIELVAPPSVNNSSNSKYLKLAYNQHKFDVVITTYEMAINASSMLKNVGLWRCVVVDEAHRLKNKSSKVGEALKSYSFEHKILLTGTPIQNSLEELWSILNFLDPEKFQDGTEKSFLATYDLRSAADVARLQSLLKPLMLRRLKEDVEKSIPVKEETIIEVELTDIQRAYYRAILERNFPFLKQGTKRQNMPNLINAMMELRKCCIHPYLLRGAEEKVIEDAKAETPQQQFKCMVEASGKLVLLDKLLPKLKAGGHRVLIFSQMTKCLDLLADYLRGRQYLFERIDGGVRGEARQGAIDRFSSPDSPTFCFLLCTRAGGVGINLTAADTCIIFDSDWNPQNDLQAQARCHRIGQKKNVKIYRLITRNTYERTMFDKAGLKLGLDKAVLSRMDSVADDQSSGNSSGALSSLSKNEIEELLRKGAYAAIMTEDAEQDEGRKFCDEDIDSILARRSQTIRHGEDGVDTTVPREASLFSKATFALEGNTKVDLDVNDPEFWDKWAQKAEIEVQPEEQKAEQSVIIESGSRRKRKRVDRLYEEDNDDGDLQSTGDKANQTPGTANNNNNSNNTSDQLQHTLFDDQEYIEWSSRREIRAAAARACGGFNPWTMAEKTRIERGLMAYGFGAWEKKKEQFPKRSINDIKAVELRLIRWCLLKLKQDRSLIDEKKQQQDQQKDDEDDVTTKAMKNRARNDFQTLREDLRLFADIEHVLETVQWQIPSLKKVEESIDFPFQFSSTAPETGVHEELGEYPYPNATVSQLLEYRSFLDDASKEYFTHLEKKPRNILLRVQSMHFLREFVFEIDSHAVSEIWINAKQWETETMKQVAPDVMWIDKYQKVFEKRKSLYQFPQAYHQAFSALNDGSATGAITGWGSTEDLDALAGMLKYGYQNYEKMREDSSLVFQGNNWVSAEAAKKIPPGTQFFVWPGGADLGQRIRRIIALLGKQLNSKTPIDPTLISKDSFSAIEARVNDNCWSKKDRSEFFKAVHSLGLPDFQTIQVESEEEAKQRNYQIIQRYSDGKVTCRTRDWTAFRKIAQGLDQKTDFALEMFTRLFVRRAEDFVRKSAPNGLTGDLCVSGRVSSENDNSELYPEPEVEILDLSGNSLDPCNGMALDRARRLLRRIVFMRSLRMMLFEDGNLELKLSFAKRSPGLPEWWIVGKHDKAFLEGIIKYGMTPSQQIQIMFDPDLPFRSIVVDRLKQSGLTDDQIQALEGRNDSEEDDEESSSTPAASTNVEEIVGWPKDMIRSRRVEILMDLVMNPSHKALSMMHSLNKESSIGKKESIIDFDTGAIKMADKLQKSFQSDENPFKIKLDLNSASTHLLPDEERIISSSLKRLKRAIKYIKRHSNSRALVDILKEFNDSSSSALSLKKMDIDSGHEEDQHDNDSE